MWLFKQKVTAEEQEINNQVQRLRGSEEECGLMKKELAALQHRLGNKSRQLKVWTNFHWHRF